MVKDSIILNHTGEPVKPVKKEKENADSNFPTDVQALIDTRLNTAIDEIRERNQYDLKDLAKEYSKKWRTCAFISTGIIIISFFVAPQQIIKWIGDQVDKKLTEPMIRESADRMIESKMGTFIDKKMKPLNEQTNALEKA